MNGRRLYDEIGGVDERYLQEAATYRARRKAPTWRVALIAAVLTLVGALLLGTLAMSVGIAIVGGILHDALNQAPEAPEQNEEVPVNYTIASMEQTLAHEQEYMQPTDADGIELFDGSAQLIWTDSESGEYYRVRLSHSELGNLLYLMQKNPKDISVDSEQPAYQIWICFGDGTVVSPYLKANAGNAGHGQLFDYDPELELSRELIKLIMYCVET